MAANIYQEEARDLKVRAFVTAGHDFLRINPDGFEDDRYALEVLMDRLGGLLGDEVADRQWDVLQELATQVTGIRHGRPSHKVRTQVLGQLWLDLCALSTRPVLVDAFAGLPS
jgi:hypothetical protein